MTCPAGRDRVYVYDLRVPGLAFCMTATGRRSFYVYKRVQHRPQRIRLGAYPDLSIEQARTLTATTAGDIARGIDPQAEKRAARRAGMTLGELFDQYIERHAKVHKRTHADDRYRFDLHVGHWKGRQLATIDEDAVRALHAKLGAEHGHYAANRILALLSSVFAKMKWKSNPARHVDRFPEQQRERFLHPDELPKFFKALDAEPNETARDLIYLLLLTGARRGNVQSMRWADVNLDRRTWTIPASQSKNGKALTVHLAPEAVKILKRRRPRDVDAEPYAFPGRGGSGHLREPKKAWAAVLKRAGISDLRLHDLRRTLGSWQAAGGASLSVIGKSLGHQSIASTAIYARLSIDPVRTSVNSAVRSMLATRRAKRKRQ